MSPRIWLAVATSLLALLVAPRVDGSAHDEPGEAPEIQAAVAALRSLRTSYVRSPEGLPTSFLHELTAWQTTPRGLVLAGDRTPDEEDPYVLTHPLFAFGWPDGRTLLVDAGLGPAGAAEFGRTPGWVGAEPIVCGRDPFAGLDAGRIEGVVFTHLHVDHLDGLREICADGDALPVRLSPEQRASRERFEARGREALATLAEEGCVREEPWALVGESLAAPGLAGFPGIHRVAVPGHTPGSQLVVGFVRRTAEAPASREPLRAVVVSGDVVNHRAGLRHDRPKPWWYRKLLVREDDALQARNRALLRRLGDEGFEIWVNHHVPVPAGIPAMPCE